MKKCDHSIHQHVLVYQGKTYFANKSYTAVQANFRREFRCRNAPSKSRIFDWVKKFREHGSVQNFNSKGITDTHSGRRVSPRTERNINEVGKSVGWSPKKSFRRRSQELGISSRVFGACSQIRSSFENVEETLSKFSLQLDESTLPGNDLLLLAYVRFIKGGSLCQELLFARLLDTKEESVYRAVEDYFQKKSIPLTNIISCATDGAQSMVGHHGGFLSYLKKAIPKVLTVHCVIHRQHLVRSTE